MNINVIIDSMLFPIGSFILGLLSIIFHKSIGKLLYKIQEFYEYHTKHSSHMRTLFKYHDRIFGEKRDIEYYYKTPIKIGFFLIGVSIVDTLLFVL